MKAIIVSVHDKTVACDALHLMLVRRVHDTSSNGHVCAMISLLADVHPFRGTLHRVTNCDGRDRWDHIIERHRRHHHEFPEKN